jgi:hypothetical protein
VLGVKGLLRAGEKLARSITSPLPEKPELDHSIMNA